MNLNFNKRKSFWFKDDKRIGLEFSGFDNSPSLQIQFDGGDKSVTFIIAFGFFFALTIERFLSKKWFPHYQSRTYGELPEEREISISFHHWSLWWSFWMKPHEWDSTDSKWRRGSFNFKDLFIGKHTCEWEILETRDGLVSMIEGNYPVRAKQKLRIDKWERWFTEKSITYEVEVGHINEEGKYVESSIPIEGKSENSWDCDENGRVSSSFPSKPYCGFNIKNIDDAILFFQLNILQDRIKYGGRKWIPKAFKNDEIKIIK